MRGTKVNRVSNRKMYRLHCVLKISRPQNLYYLLGERWNFDQFFNFYLTVITICSSPLGSQFNDIQMKVKNCLRMEISLGLEKT